MFNLLYLMQKRDAVWVHKLWPKITTWYNFWITSQRVHKPDLTMLFKWWGPNEDVNFGSGMDDWPRTIPGHIGKYNVDASAWAWFFADSMSKMSKESD